MAISSPVIRFRAANPATPSNDLMALFKGSRFMRGFPVAPDCCATMSARLIRKCTAATILRPGFVTHPWRMVGSLHFVRATKLEE